MMSNKIYLQKGFLLIVSIGCLNLNQVVILWLNWNRTLSVPLEQNAGLQKYQCLQLGRPPKMGFMNI